MDKDQLNSYINSLLSTEDNNNDDEHYKKMVEIIDKNLFLTTKERSQYARVNKIIRSEIIEMKKIKKRETDDNINNNINSVNKTIIITNNSFQNNNNNNITFKQSSVMITTPKWLLFNGYQYCQLLDEGTYGRIYRAKNIKTGQIVAVKQIDRTNNSIQQWLENGCMDREMKIMLAIRHQNLVGALDVMKFRTIAFIVMPLIDGGNVRTLMFEQCRPLDEKCAKKWFYDMSKGLNYLHQNQIVHRDLKLENLLIEKRHNRLMIADFGFAKMLTTTQNKLQETKSKKTKTSPLLNVTTKKSCNYNICYSPCGTIEYTSPEVNLIRMNYMENQSSKINNPGYDAKAADVYSMGVCLYEMLHFCKAFLQPEECSIITDTLCKLRLVYPRQMNQQFTPNRHVRLSTECTQLLFLLMASDPLKRPTVKEILSNDQWLKKIIQREKLKQEKMKQITTLIQEYLLIDDDQDENKEECRTKRNHSIEQLSTLSKVLYLQSLPIKLGRQSKSKKMRFRTLDHFDLNSKEKEDHG